MTKNPSKTNVFGYQPTGVRGMYLSEGTARWNTPNPLTDTPFQGGQAHG